MWVHCVCIFCLWEIYFWQKIGGSVWHFRMWKWNNGWQGILYSSLGLVGVLFLLLVFPHTGNLFFVCSFYCYCFHMPVGLVSVLLVFPDAMDLFLGSVSFVLLIFLQTENLFSDLVGVLFILSMFPHNSHLHVLGPCRYLIY